MSAQPHQRMKLTTWAAASGGTSMEALYLVCGAHKPQLMPIPLGRLKNE